MKPELKECREVVRQWSCVNGSRKLLYRVLRCRKYSEELDWFTTFGVEIADLLEDKRAVLEDISPNCDAVMRFAGLCCSLQVSPDQLRDTAENFLAVRYGGIINAGDVWEGLEEREKSTMEKMVERK